MRPEQAEDLTRSDGEVDRVHRHEVPVVPGQLLDLDHRITSGGGAVLISVALRGVGWRVPGRSDPSARSPGFGGSRTEPKHEGVQTFPALLEIKVAPVGAGDLPGQAQTETDATGVAASC